MALINLKCSNCNGTIQMDDTKENGFCMYCGARFLVRDEVQRILVQHSGSVNLNREKEIENLIIRAEQKMNEIIIFKEETCKELKDNYIEKILDMDSSNARALELKSEINNRIQKRILEDKKLNKKIGIGCLIVVVIFLFYLFYILG